MTQVVVRLTKLVAKSSLPVFLLRSSPPHPRRHINSSNSSIFSILNPQCARGGERQACSLASLQHNVLMFEYHIGGQMPNGARFEQAKKTTTSSYNGKAEWKLLCEEQLYCLNTTQVI